MAILSQRGEYGTDDLGRLCSQVDAQLAGGNVSPEDLEARMALLQPLEDYVSPLRKRPSLPGTPAGHLAAALWIKYHPTEGSPDEMLSLMANDSALVRSVAADAMAASLRADSRFASNPALVASARQAILRQRRAETSPVVSYQLDQLVELLPKPTHIRAQSTPRLIASPYVAGLPVSGTKSFVGREDVLNEIRQLLRPNSGVKSIVLYGTRRSGKTSILYRIREHVLGDGIIPVYLDMQALAGASSIELVRVLIDQTTDALRASHIELPEGWKEEAGSPLQLTDLQRFFRGVFKQINGASLVLLMDEYEVLDSLISDHNVVRQLQHLLEHEAQFFVIFAGSRKLEALQNPTFLTLLDVSRDIRISFLKRTEAIHLITAPGGNRVEYEPAVIERLLDLTGGHPFYIQLLCHSLFTAVDGVGRVDEETLSAVVTQFIENPAPHLILTWTSLSLEQRAAAVALAVGGPGTKHKVADILRQERYPAHLRLGEVEQALEDLTRVDLVRKNVETRSYGFTMQIVQLWITASHSLMRIGEDYRDDVLKQVAHFWRQRVSSLIDAGILSVLGVMLAIVRDGGSTLWMIYVPLIVAYYTLPFTFTQSSFGQRLAHVRVVRTSARMLRPSEAFRYGLTLSARFLLFVALIVALGHTLLEMPLQLWHRAALIAFPVLFVADSLVMLYSRNRQGMIDKLLGTVVVSAKAVRE